MALLDSLGGFVLGVGQQVAVPVEGVAPPTEHMHVFALVQGERTLGRAAFVGVTLAITSVACKVEALALIAGMALVAFFSGPIADAFFGPKTGRWLAARRLIADRGSESQDENDGRRAALASLARLVLLLWAGVAAVGGLMVLVGVLHCG